MVLNDNKTTLELLAGTRSGRIFIIGSGPSMRQQIDILPRLRDEDTFGCNRLLLWKDLPFTPLFYACNHRRIATGVETSIENMKGNRFVVSYQSGGLPGWVAVHKKSDVPFGGINGVVQPVCGGGSMALIMAQISAVLGYTEIYLLGCEQRAGEHVYGYTAIDFVPPPDMDLFRLWANLKQEYSDSGISLMDCTPNGRLSQTDTLDYANLEVIL